MKYELTVEQQAVVRHPLGHHARVLAVAGAGKTTTMVQRIRHLIENHGIMPNSILVLMYNRRARLQFQEKVAEVLPATRHPQIHTFHSFAYKIISDASNRGIFPSDLETWIGDKEERIRFSVHQAIQKLEREGTIPPDVVDPDDAVESISLWKGSLIPPHRAGHRISPYLPLVYQEYERIRVEKNAMTFDDFVPIAVDILQEEASISGNVVNSFAAILVDEYQDINFGQQRLIEIVAGNRADIMVVGDDDQTIYEWRGARSNYIIREFGQVFSRKRVIDYTLSRTFRFGPLIAQAAQNVISGNIGRIPKRIIAAGTGKDAAIIVTRGAPNQPTDVNKELAKQIVALARQTKSAENIVVLARMYSQLNGLEAELLAQKIPYRVSGRSPFYERREIVALLDYIRLALLFTQQLDQNALNLILSVANTPNRKVSKDLISRTAKALATYGFTTGQFLHHLASSSDSPLISKQRAEMSDFADVLDRLHERIRDEPKLNAGALIRWLIDRLDYFSHFDNYYGQGEQSEDRKRSVASFCTFAEGLNGTARDLLQHIRTLDTTRGAPTDQQIVLTTVFKVKGEEYDYIFIPNCEDGYMPCLIESGNEIYDKSGQVVEPPQSDAMNNERRLFYVAITRARKAVYIGASTGTTQVTKIASSSSEPSRFIDELRLEPTQQIMGAYQRLASGHKDAVSDLHQSLRRHAGQKDVINNLISFYLPEIGVTLPADLTRHLEATPAMAIQPKQPSVVKQQRTSFSDLAIDAKRPWWEEN